MTVPDAPGAPLRSARVLHICTRYLRGGSERRLVDVVRATPELDHHVIVGRDSEPELLLAACPDAAVEVMPTLRPVPSPVPDVATFRALRRRVHHGRFDVVHTHQSKAGVLGRLAARRSGAKTIHSLSMANFGPGFGAAASLVYRSAERMLGPRTDAYVVVGDELALRYAGLGIDAARMVVVRSSVDLELYADPVSPAAARTALGVPLGVPVLAYIGRFEETKAVSELPALLEQVRGRTAQDVHLVLAGDGPLLASVEADLVRRGLDAVTTVLGHTGAVHTVLAAADCVVLLSRCEGLSQVLVQALAARRPFVATATDGAAEMAARTPAARVVPIGAVDAAAAACAELLDEPAPPPVDLREWTSETVTAAYRALYGHLLGTALPAARR